MGIIFVVENIGVQAAQLAVLLLSILFTSVSLPPNYM